MKKRRCHMLSIWVFGPLFLLAAGCRTAPRYQHLDTVANGGRQWFQAIEKAAAKLADDGRLTAPGDLLTTLPAKTRLKAPRPVGRYRSGPDLYRHARRATVVVGAVRNCTNPRCSIRKHVNPASGVIVHPAGIVATNYHVIQKTNHLGLVVGTDDGRVFPVVEILAANEKQDVALLRIEGEAFPFLPPAGDAPPGTDIYVLSHPRQEMYQMSKGVVTGYHIRKTYDKETKTVGERRSMNVSADYAKGSSGGPILDAYGRVVGLVSATEPVYYIEKPEEHDLIQMVIKRCVPGSDIVSLFAPDRASDTGSKPRADNL
ncbi:MAG: serine protease [Lentisphaeria bacterium]|nr:serine protease [Lentisphaeria bacterium]